MSRLEGLSNKEIAEEENIAQNTVKKHIHLAITDLKKSDNLKN
ncbi:MAG: RNA polymerase subunit sigma-70, partial [Bacteroidales bacterium]|nr:RNA polymerase subunit sigma-70 [Bacteroidales bacterium]